MSFTPVRDITALAALARLRSLYLTGTLDRGHSPAGEAEVSHPAGPGRLGRRRPGATGRAVAQIWPACNCRAHRIVDLSPLAGLTELRILELGDTAVSDLSPAGRPAQTSDGLDIRGTRVTESDARAALPNCEIVSVSLGFGKRGSQIRSRSASRDLGWRYKRGCIKRNHRLAGVARGPAARRSATAAKRQATIGRICSIPKPAAPMPAISAAAAAIKATPCPAEGGVGPGRERIDDQAHAPHKAGRTPRRVSLPPRARTTGIRRSRLRTRSAAAAPLRRIRQRSGTTGDLASPRG